MTKFSLVLEPDDNGTFLVSFPDLPEAHTFGETQDDALAHAVDALVTALEARIADREPIPNPASVAQGHPFVVVPPLVDAKVYLYRTMRQQHITKAQLAKRLNVHPPQVDRLLNLRHQSRFDHLETAFKLVGYSLYVQIAKTVQPSWVMPRPAPKAAPARRRTTAAGSRKR